MSILTDIDKNDPLQRFGRVKVEATSFTISEPYEAMTITPIIYTKASAEERLILEEQFDVIPFPVQTIKLERIFVDKIFATEFYYIRYKDSGSDIETNYAFDVAKHIYDLMILHEHPKIQALLVNPDWLKKLISFKREEETIRMGGIPSDLTIKSFSYLTELLLDKNFEVEYNRMQDIYVFQDENKVPLTEAVAVLEAIKTISE